MKWEPIETAPATPIEDEPELILVYVADGGKNRKGAVAFGYAYLSVVGTRKVKALGYGGNAEWKITHWMPLPEPPND